MLKVIIADDEARVCSNTLCIAKSRNEVRAQNFRKAPRQRDRSLRKDSAILHYSSLLTPAFTKGFLICPKCAILISQKHIDRGIANERNHSCRR